MVKAMWNGTVIAESDDTVIVDGNHYFPPDAIKPGLMQPTDKRTVCGWKGTAHYFTIVTESEKNEDAAWTYPETKPEADNIRGYVAFWRGVEVA